MEVVFLLFICVGLFVFSEEKNAVNIARGNEDLFALLFIVFFFWASYNIIFPDIDFGNQNWMM